VLNLRIVSSDTVRPHEIADPARERRIEARLRHDGLLRDPLIVGAVQGVNGYVLLDGTNRKRALANLGLPRVMVQIIDYGDEHAASLRAWCHLAHISIDELTAGAGTIPHVAVHPVAELGATDALRAPGTMALLLSSSVQYVVSRLPTAGSTTAQLRTFVDLYEARMTRVDCSPEDVEERAQSLTADVTLVAFPGFSRSQVVTMALKGSLIPAGITRHVILAGRALRVNLPLELLSGTLDVDATSAALDRHLAGLQPRIYQEPTVLFDS
jgi:hypothetical protein